MRFQLIDFDLETFGILETRWLKMEVPKYFWIFLTNMLFYKQHQLLIIPLTVLVFWVWSNYIKDYRLVIYINHGRLTGLTTLPKNRVENTECLTYKLSKITKHYHGHNVQKPAYALTCTYNLELARVTVRRGFLLISMLVLQLWLKIISNYTMDTLGSNKNFYTN